MILKTPTTLFPFSTFLQNFHLGVRDRCFDFISKLYLTSKARAHYLDMLSVEFPIYCGIRQGCPLSSIFFNLFINGILNNYDKYDVSIGNKKMMWLSFC